jgi:hypothetical protein
VCVWLCAQQGGGSSRWEEGPGKAFVEKQRQTFQKAMARMDAKITKDALKLVRRRHFRILLKASPTKFAEENITRPRCPKSEGSEKGSESVVRTVHLGYVLTYECHPSPGAGG